MSSNENVSHFQRPSWRSIGTILVSIIAVGVVLLGGFWVLFVNHIDQHEVGYKVERLKGGTLSVIPEKGWVVTPPFVTKVYTIDLRPRQVCQRMGKVGTHGDTDGVNGRVLNCKLVEFNPAGLRTLIDWHGVQNGDVSGILGIYAYDQLGRPYPFLTIKEQSAPMMEQKK
jgi:hypothetical protein